MKFKGCKQFKNKLLRYQLETTEASLFMCFNNICCGFKKSKKKFKYKILIRNFLKATYYCVSKQSTFIFLFALSYDFFFTFKYVSEVVSKKFFFRFVFNKGFIKNVVKKAEIFKNIKKVQSMLSVVFNSVSQLIIISRYVLFDGLYITGYARRM
jgi:hypothetical protein